MMLLLAIIVVVPAIDAAACMVEPDTVQSHVTDPDSAPGDHAEDCAHGHCHHTVGHTPFAPLSSATIDKILLVTPEKPSPKSLLPDGLMRPPRV
jgi:hypothetical protein